MLQYRLGLDVGTNSLGWSLLHIRNDGSPVRLLDWGVRIFDDGREPAKNDIPGDSSAVQRRAARGMRRRYDRRLMRKKAVLRMLVRYGLMPEDRIARKKLESLDPLQLRNDALTRKLEPYEIGRALFHLQQRRGFKSNRKDAYRSNEAGAIKEASARLELQLVAQQTLGQFLYKRHQLRQRTRLNPKTEGNKILYDYYPTRAMTEEEFGRIWQVQAKHHPAIMTEEARASIHKAIFFQRKLKPQEKGRCTLVPEEERMAWAMPSAQRFRIIKEVNNLAIVSLEPKTPPQKLNAAQRTKLYEALCLQGSITFGKIRTLLQLSSDQKFNFEVPPRKGLEGDKTAKIMRDKERFGEKWDRFSLQQQDAIIAKLLDDSLEDETLVQWLKSEHGLATEPAERVIEAPLPPAYARFGKTVINSILPRMVNEGMQEHEAIAANPAWHHSHHYTGEIMDTLPYYGKVLEQHVVSMKKSGDPMVRQYGRIGNPTVHIALNQIRRLMNTLKRRYGCWPQEIVLEMARELKKGRQEIADIMREIEKNTKQRDKWREEIEAVKQAPATSHDFAKMKLWTELADDPTQRKCVFTGEPITIAALLSDQVEIEHILPYSRTLDDTSANKTLATRRANRIKGNKTPFEAFKDAPDGIAYESVWERAQILPPSKRWRFRSDAMDVFDSKAKTIVMKSSLGGEMQVDTGLESFAARQLNDTSYIAKLAKKYLAYACEKGECGVMATPGTLTGLLRKSWGLNALLGDNDEKNRNDHRHHAVDALVIAMTTRGMVKKVADAAGKAEQNKVDIKRVLGEAKPETVQDWNMLKERLEQIIVSHKPDHGSPGKGHGTSGRLHEDTYYGYIGEGKKKNTIEIVVRKPLDSFTKESDLADIRDPALRDALQQFVVGKADVVQALREFAASDAIEGKPNVWKGIQRVRVLAEKPRDVMVPLKKRQDGSPWKLAQGGSNHRAEIYCPKTGKKAGKWQMEVIKAFDANKPGFIPAWRRECSDADLIITLHINDMVAYKDNAADIRIARVQKIGANGQIFFVPHTVARPDKETSFSLMTGSMQPKKLRHIMVEVDGSVYDPFGELTTRREPVEAVA